MIHFALRSLTLLLASSISFAHAAPGSNVPACVFDDVLAFGASVTHATAATPGWEFLVRGLEASGAWAGTYEYPATARRNQRPYGLSPVRYLVKRYVGKAGLARVTYVSRWRTNRPEHLGSAQIASLLTGVNRPRFDAASLIVGVDGLYWDAIKNSCGPKLDRLITDLITTARDAGKVLILGNVPTEDPATVRVDGSRQPYDMWSPPVPACAARINAILDRDCTVDNRCYVANLKDVVARLLAGEELALRNGHRYGLYAMRPDGVHLSDVGARYMAELMTTALETRPIVCR